MPRNDPPTPRILLTGATGFVGGWLAEELRSACPDAALFGTTHGDNTATDSPAAQAGVELRACDLTDADAVRALVADIRPERVFHLAGFASGAGTDRAGIIAANVGATVSLLEALREVGTPCRVLLASSGYVYGATEPGRPAREDDPLHPSGAYAESKRDMEAAARPFAAPDGPLSVAIARAFNHTGPRQTEAFVVPAFARQIARIEAGLELPVVRVGNLDARRDFLGVRDVVRAYRLLVCETPPAAPAPLRVVNVASGVAVSIRDVLDRLLALSTVAIAVETDPSRLRPADLPECVGDAARLREMTGWRAAEDLEVVLRETLDYWRGRVRTEAAASG